MTRADKAYYKYRAKTIFWSAFCLVIISWVGTNLVLCALTTNVKSDGDLIYEVPVHDVYLPTGKELNKTIKNSTKHTTTDFVIKTITFDKYTENKTYFAGGGQEDLIAGITAETINAQDGIYLYRLNDGADIYILSRNDMIANDDLSYCFSDFRYLTQIKFNNFDASKGNIVDMSYMFEDDVELDFTKTDMNTFNTQNVTDMRRTFANCKELASLDKIKNWDFRCCEFFDEMFLSCTGLVNVDLGVWEIENVFSFDGMFKNCSNIEVFTSKLMFNNVGGRLISFASMFESCSSLKKIDFNDWHMTSNVFVTSVNNMFDGCSNLTTVSFGWGCGWDQALFGPLPSFNYVFRNCINLQSVEFGDNFSTTSSPREFKAAFYNCKNLTMVDISPLLNEGHTYVQGDFTMDEMFYGCENLGKIYVSSNLWTGKNIDSSQNMFYGCEKLVGGQGTSYDANRVDGTYARIDGGPSSSTPGYFAAK